jgi:hypothetical protein
MGLQDWFITSFVEPVYQEWLASALLRGDITFEVSGKSLPADKLGKFADASAFRGRRWRWVDPAKELDAYKGAVELGITSRTRIAAEQGDDFDDVLDELAQEDAALDEAGLKPAAPAAPMPPPAPDTEVTDLAKALLARSLEHRESAPAPAPQITIHNAPPAIHLTQGEVRTEVTVEPAAAPNVEVRNAITTPEPVVNVEAHFEARMPEQPAPVVEVNVETPDTLHIASLPARRTTTDIVRDPATGDIISSDQIEADL